MAAIVPMGRRSLGSGSFLSVVCSVRKRSRSLFSARLTESIDIGRLIASGCRVRGKTTVSRSATTGSSLGYVRSASDAMLQCSGSDGDQGAATDIGRGDGRFGRQGDGG